MERISRPYQQFIKNIAEIHPDKTRPINQQQQQQQEKMLQVLIRA